MVGPKDAQWTLVTSGVISVMGTLGIWDEDEIRDVFPLGVGEDGTPVPGGSGKETSFRVRSGFNPTQLNFIALGPKNLLVDVAAHFMLATSLQSSKTMFVGNTIETRILEIRLSGKYGTLGFGKGINFFERAATFNDIGSIMGMGFTPSPDSAGPAFGRIGTGYTWVDFSPRIYWTSPAAGGFQFTVGVFDPIEDGFGEFAGGDVPQAIFGGLPPNGPAQLTLETSVPRFEAEATFGTPLGESGNLLIFASGLFQPIKNKANDESVTLLGVNGGLRLSFAGFNIRGSASFSKGAGIIGFFGFFQPDSPAGFPGPGVSCNATACEAAEMFQWWVGVDYDIPGTGVRIGGSYGRGDQTEVDDFVLIGDAQNELIMGFIHYQLLPFQNLTFEYDFFDGDAIFQFRQKYMSFTIGTQLMF